MNERDTTDRLVRRWGLRFRVHPRPAIRINKGVLARALNCYPDVVFTDENGRWIVAVERKDNRQPHRMSEALGQCLLYKTQARQAVICIPQDSMQWLAPAFHDAAAIAGIQIISDSKLRHWLNINAPECKLTPDSRATRAAEAAKIFRSIHRRMPTPINATKEKRGDIDTWTDNERQIARAQLEPLVQLYQRLG